MIALAVALFIAAGLQLFALVSLPARVGKTREPLTAKDATAQMLFGLAFLVTYTLAAIVVLRAT